MHTVTPQVYLVGASSIFTDDVDRYLTDYGGASWAAHRFPDHDGTPIDHTALLTEFAGRICYRSWEPGLNANVTQIRRDQRAYLANLIRVGHFSTFEHVTLSFVLADVSRVLTHELVRHRVGTAVSQESFRYVRLGEIGFWDDPQLSAETTAEGHALIEAFEAFYARAVTRERLDEGDFARKKALTSALRRYAPHGLATALLWTANLRTLRHTIALRTAPEAEAEIRLLFDRIALHTVSIAPQILQDFERQADGTWRPGRPA